MSYTYGTFLGKGSYGSVYEATHDVTRRTYAAKKIQKNRVDFIELDVLSRVRSPYVLHAEDMYEEGDDMVIILPKATDNLHRHHLDVEAAHRACLQLGLGVAHLHEAGIIHGDIKASNSLMINGDAVVADFGLSRYKNPNVVRDLMYTDDHRPPEFDDGSVYEWKHSVKAVLTERSDSFALACTWYYLLSRQSLFENVGTGDQLSFRFREDRILEAVTIVYDRLNRHAARTGMDDARKQRLWRGLSQMLLIGARMLDMDVNKRPTPAEALRELHFYIPSETPMSTKCIEENVDFVEEMAQSGMDAELSILILDLYTRVYEVFKDKEKARKVSSFIAHNLLSIRQRIPADEIRALWNDSIHAALALGGQLYSNNLFTNASSLSDLAIQFQEVLSKQKHLCRDGYDRRYSEDKYTSMAHVMAQKRSVIEDGFIRTSIPVQSINLVEMDIMGRSRSKYVFRAMRFEKEKDLIVILEAPVESLRSSISDITDPIPVCSELAKGLFDLHRLGVLHGSVDLDAFQRMKDGRWVIAKFENATYAPARYVEVNPYDPSFSPPEAELEEIQLTLKSDVYALGCVLYTVLSGKSYKEKTRTQWVTTMQENEKRLREVFGKELIDLLKSMLEENPSLRPSSEKVVEAFAEMGFGSWEAEERLPYNCYAEDRTLIQSTLAEEYNVQYETPVGAVVLALDLYHRIAPHMPSQDVAKQVAAFMIAEIFSEEIAEMWDKSHELMRRKATFYSEDGEIETREGDYYPRRKDLLPRRELQELTATAVAALQGNIYRNNLFTDAMSLDDVIDNLKDVFVGRRSLCSNERLRRVVNAAKSIEYGNVRERIVK